ncbi:hypothetical protein FNV43_RR11383 [Rhamnella rubrinervis]|uniref:Cathepsin propeptide inhibitor domain-containing protein n=1 Tax=Rhamnella rubrinervis TaxID=2594499 RepID=A0A8K0H610_9ROSA|nr:hypothetical protein FNV43_RR11383 [Rhamnella rubrinervis]
MATLFRSVYTRSSKLAFGSSRTSPLPGFTKSSSAFVVRPSVTFTVPNRSPTRYPDVNTVGKATLSNLLASKSQEELKYLLRDGLSAKLNLLNGGLTDKLSFSNSQLFEIWCKIYDKSYSSQQEKLNKFRVFEDNIKISMDMNKLSEHNRGAKTLKVYSSLNFYADLTPAETKKFLGIGSGLSYEKMKEYVKDADFPVMKPGKELEEYLAHLRRRAAKNVFKNS